MFATIGSFLLAICGLPEAYRAHKLKHCGVGWSMLLLWLVGELCLVAFALQSRQYILLVNYFANILFILIMVYYKSRGSNVI